MAVLIPCIRGKIGSTEYYQGKMTAYELVKSVRSPSELDEWASTGVEERWQREANKTRIEKEIAPYIAQTKDRFFGSLIVLIYEGQLEFDELKGFNAKIPSIFQAAAKDIGFLSIDKAILVVLDGQHRLLALDKVVKHEVQGEYSREVPNDEISVIFIKYENPEKTRRIFNKVNKYAKSTSRGDNIITNVDDAHAIIARRLMQEDEPFGITYETDKGQTEHIINWKNTSIPQRSLQFTTISALNDIAKIILNSKGIEINQHMKPQDEDLDEWYAIVREYWELVIDNILVYKSALENNRLLPEYRKPDSDYSLLFKPAAQIALFRALMNIERKMDIKEALIKMNEIDWSMRSPIWTDIIVRSSITIDPKLEAQERAAKLVYYLVAAEHMTNEEIKQIKLMYNQARGNFEEDLPSPIVSK